MVDYYFARAQGFEEAVASHDCFVADYNTQKTQKYFACQERKDGRQSPAEVLGWLVRVRHIPSVTSTKS